MGFAPKGLKKGDTFTDCGITYRVIDVTGDRYISEIVKEEPKQEEPKQEKLPLGEDDPAEKALKEEDEKDLSELPFSDVEVPEKKIRHRK